MGRGRGFGVHKSLDLIGAVSGPLLVAAVLAGTGVLWPSMLVLIVPGILTMALLFWMRRRVPDPSIYDPTRGATDSTRTASEPATWWGQALGRGLPGEFFIYAAAVGLTTGGLVSYGIISFHFTREGLVALPVVPVIFALGMAAAAIAALANGWLYDRVGPRVLLVLPLLVALVPPLTLGGNLGWTLHRDHLLGRRQRTAGLNDQSSGRRHDPRHPKGDGIWGVRRHSGPRRPGRRRCRRRSL